MARRSVGGARAGVSGGSQLGAVLGIGSGGVVVADWVLPYQNGIRYRAEGAKRPRRSERVSKRLARSLDPRLPFAPAHRDGGGV